MRSATLLALVAPSLLLAACNAQEAVITEVAYPKMALSQGLLEFGTASWGETVERTVTLRQEGVSADGVGMKMGVSAIEIGEHMGGNFSVTYDLAEMTCGDGASTPAAKGVDADSGTTPSDTGDTADTGGTTPQSAVLFTMDPLCELPLHVTFAPVDVGEVWGGLVITTAKADLPSDAADDALPEYEKDPVHSQQEVWLHADAEHAAGTLVVRPRTYDFGYVNPSDTEDHVAYIELENVGDGDVTIHSVSLSETCDTSFAMDVSPPAESTVAPGQKGLVAVSFHPTDANGAYCQAIVTSDDPANPEVDITLTGNSGTDALNHQPTAAIRDPENGYRYTTIRDLTLELNIFDADQPATTLNCRVRSAVLQNANLASCPAPDDSGHMWITIPREDLDEGIDTLVLTVTDGTSTSAEDSVSILIDTDYPADDDDGDGYGPTSDPPDCDDSNRDTYPEAVEVYDSDDNNCDGQIDEDTIGADDDGDGVSEIAGDCNDFDRTAYPGAPERGDGVDNDCDGVVDEGTSLYDDDGDGYAEVNNDCNDTREDINPAAAELCGDNIDNDCDGLKDGADGCVASDSQPMIIGVVRSNDANACEVGEVVTLEVKVFDPDGQIPTITWQDDSDSAAENFDNQSSNTVHWTCPELASGSGGKAFNVLVNVSDPDGNVDSAFVKISVYPEDYGLHDPLQLVEFVDAKGCASAPRAPGGMLVAGGALAAALLRRRRQ